MCNKEWFQEGHGSSLSVTRGVTGAKSRDYNLAEQFKWEVLVHPPYSPELSPCDYAIFDPLKKALRGKRFAFDNDVKQYVRN